MKLVKTKTGIVSYGGYIPRFRIRSADIASVYDKSPESIRSGLGIIEKTVPGLDEDTVTVAVNAARKAIARLRGAGYGVREDNNTNLEPRTSYPIGAIYVGSESHPYAVKPTAVTVGEALGIGNDYTAADTEFACKAGTAAMQMVMGLIDSGRIDFGFAIGADTAQSSPGDPLEYSAGCAAASFLLGNKNVIAKIIHTSSFTSDTPDFWRREHEVYPKHGGRFTGEEAYFKHIISSTKKILTEAKMQIKDFDHIVLHMPNGKFPKTVAKILEINDKQLERSFIVPFIGNSYSACSMIGLINVLDFAKPGEKILMTSYGSGAGSDSFIFEITNEIENLDRSKKLSDQFDKKVYLNYGQYLRHTGKV